MWELTMPLLLDKRYEDDTGVLRKNGDVVVLNVRKMVMV